MIEARALVSINFLNLSENYDFMSRWLGVYDKYAKLLKGSSDAVVKDGSGKIPESCKLTKSGFNQQAFGITGYISLNMVKS